MGEKRGQSKAEAQDSQQGEGVDLAPPACTQEGNFTLGAGLLRPLADIPSPIPAGVCCPWARLQPVTNLDLSLQFTSLICQGGEIKKTEEKQT